MATGLLLSLLVATLACGGPAQDVTPGSPAAQATDTRRTQVAQVQLIISNPSTPTPPPAPTATPMPTCPNAIWWTDARAHIGESRTVQGTIVGLHAAPAGMTLLALGQPYPDPTGVAVMLSSGDAAGLNGKDVCVAGHIELVEGLPTLQVRDTSGITVVN